MIERKGSYEEYLLYKENKKKADEEEAKRRAVPNISRQEVIDRFKRERDAVVQKVYNPDTNTYSIDFNVDEELSVISKVISFLEESEKEYFSEDMVEELVYLARPCSWRWRPDKQAQAYCKIKLMLGLDVSEYSYLF